MTKNDLLLAIATANDEGRQPRVPPLYDVQLRALLTRGLITYIGGYAELTAEGAEHARKRRVAYGVPRLRL